MYIWVAATTSEEGASVFMQQQAEDNSLKGNSVALEKGVWIKLTFELTDENKALLFAENGGRITRFYCWYEQGATELTTYFGDIGFEKTEEN